MMELFYRSMLHDEQRLWLRRMAERRVQMMRDEREIQAILDVPKSLRTKQMKQRLEALYKRRERFLRPHINRRARERYEGDHGNSQAKKDRQAEYYRQNRDYILERFARFREMHKLEYKEHARAYRAKRRREGKAA